jgi:hypothetical protein
MYVTDGIIGNRIALGNPLCQDAGSPRGPTPGDRHPLAALRLQDRRELIGDGP